MKKAIILYSSLSLLSASCGETKQADSDSVTVVTKDSAQEQTVERIVMKEPKVFYYDYNEQRGTEDGIEMSKGDAIAEMQNLPATDGNFFGLELSDGKVVQFMYDGPKGTWFLDIPNPVTQDSYNADITMEDAVKIIGDLYDGKNADDIQAAYK